MIERLWQMLRDHRAMNFVREGNGDVSLIFVVVGGNLDDPPYHGFECDLYQGTTNHFSVDPAEAIIGAIEKHRRLKD